MNKLTVRKENATLYLLLRIHTKNKNKRTTISTSDVDYSIFNLKGKIYVTVCEQYLCYRFSNVHYTECNEMPPTWTPSLEQILIRVCTHVILANWGVSRYAPVRFLLGRIGCASKGSTQAS
jgi:hypothetical protein